MSKSSNTLLIVVAGAVAMGAGFWLSSSQTSSPDSNTPTTSEQVMGFHGTRLPVPRKLAMPELSKADGTAFTLADISGHWSLLFYGYTSCPDICPTTMNMLAAAKKQAQIDFPQVYFISVDPARDTLPNLAAYVQYFDKDFTGVTGSEKMLQALALQTSAVFMKAPAASGSENDYLMDHSSALLMINPQGQLVAFINPPHTAASILKAVTAIKQ